MLTWTHRGISCGGQCCCFENSVEKLRLRDWWTIFCGSGSDTITHGPFGKLRTKRHNIGLLLDDAGKLWYSEQEFVDVFLRTEHHLHHVLQSHYHNKIAAMVTSRKGYEDLDGFDYGLTISGDHHYSSAGKEQLMIVRDGTSYTQNTLSKFDARLTAICGWCHELDTKEHRYETCSKYDHIRARHQELSACGISCHVAFA